MRKLLLSATVVALSVNLATNVVLAQEPNPQGTPLDITTNIENKTGTGEGGAYHNSGILNVGTEAGDKVIFSGNSVTAGGGYGGYGGAIWSGDGKDAAGNPLPAKSELTIFDNVEFNSNTSNLAGGALSLNGGLKTVIHNLVKFDGNTASESGYGGAIYITTTRQEINLAVGNNATFNQNIAGTGGAIYSNDAQITFGNNAVFSGNEAKEGSGGAIYTWDSKLTGNGKVSFGESAQFTGNKAASSGGAIVNYDGRIDVGKGAEFSSNYANDGNGGAIANNVYGGTVANTQVNIAGGTTFTGNHADAGSGGAVYNAGTLNLNSDDGNITFSGNSASTGKDVYLADGSVMKVTGSNTVSFQSGEGAIAGTGNIEKTGAGTFELVGSDISTSYTGTYTQDAGTLSLDNSTMSEKFDIKNGNLVLRNGSKIFMSENGKMAAGTIQIGDSAARAASDPSVLTLKNGGQIASVVNLLLYNNNEIVIDTGSEANYGGSGDVWAGKVTLKGGTLNYEGLSTNGQLVAESGNLNINNGTLTVAGVDAANASSIATDVNVDLKTASTNLVIGDNGTVTLDNGDKWVGKVTVNGDTAALTVDNVASNGALDAQKGSVTLSAGELTIGNDSTIAGDVATSIDTNTVLNVSGGNVTLTDNDTWNSNGKVNLTNGNLTLNNVTNGKLVANGGALELQAGDLNIGTDSSISANTQTTLTQGTVDITGTGSIALNTGDTWSNNTTIKINGGTLDYNNLTSNGILQAVTGALNVNSGTLTLTTGSSVAEAVTTSVIGDVNLTGGSLALNGSDSWTGAIDMTGGTLDYALASNGKLTASAGNINVSGTGSQLTLGSGSSISGTTVTQVSGTGNTLTVGNGAVISGGQTSVATGNNFVIASGGEISGGTNSAVDSITNSGTISGGTNTAATITNNGRITDGTNTATTLLTNNNEISGGTNSAATLTNNGTISGGTNSVTTTLTNNSTGQITGGTTTIASGATLSNAGQIKGSAIVNIEGTGENTGTISGGTTTIKDGGSLTNSGTISGGEININSGAQLTNSSNITGGDIDVSGTLQNDQSISGGNIEVNGLLTNNNSIGGNSILTINANGEVTVNNGASVNTSGLITIAENGTLTINDGGSATLKQNDVWNGSIDVTNGTLTLNNRNDEGKNYTQTGGELKLDGSKFVLDDGGSITGGQVTVSNGSNFDIGDTGHMTGGDLVFEGTGNTVNVSGEVTADAELSINNNNIFNIKSNGDVVLNDNDIWTNGTVQLNGGKLDFQGTVDADGTKTNGLLTANSGTLLVNSALNITNGSTIAQLVDTTINKDVTIQSGGSVELNTGDTWASDATITVNGGSLAYNDLTSNGIIKGETGKINVNTGTLTVGDGSYIKDSVTTTIGSGVEGENAIVDITKGEVSLNTGDTWNSNGTINVNGGTLTYNDITSNATLNAQTGSVNIASGNLTLANGSAIAEAVKTTVAGTLDVQNGTVTLDNATGDIWTGTVKLGGDGTLNLNTITNGTLITDGGTLNFNSGELNIKGTSVIGAATDALLSGENIYIAEGGTVTLDDNTKDSWSNDTTITLQQGGTFDYNLQSNGTLKAEGGNLTTQKDSELTLNSDSFINKEVTANLAGNTTIQDGAVVSLGNDGVTPTGGSDTLTGDVTIENGGTLNLFNDVVMKTPVEGETNQQIAISGIMNLDTTKELHLNADLSGAGDINKNGEGDVWFHGENSGYTGTILVDNGGDLLFENGLAGNLVFGNIDGKTIGIHADEITGDLTQEREATIKYTTYHDDRDLELNGNIDVSKGTLIAESKGNNNVLFGGTVNVVPADDAQNPVSMNASSNGSITFEQNVDIENATLNVASGLGTIFNQNTTLNNSTLNAASGALTFNNLIFEGTNSVVNTMNGAVNDHVIDNLDIYDTGVSNFQIDVSTRDWKSDTFKISDITDLDGGKINVSDWQFIGKAPIDHDIRIQVFDVNNVDPTLIGNIEFTQTDKQIFTPIGWYQLSNQTQYNPITGMRQPIAGALKAKLVRFNPQVFRGQASTVATYANQLVTNNILFDHIFTVSNQLLAENNANRYAAVYPQFAPYQYSRKDGSLWFKTYGTLEHIHMTQGLDVENNAYGALVGADFPVVEMKNGWSFLPTAYVGYNGAHQNFDGVGMFQNGGQLGAMGTFMKKDFIGSLLLYGGGYGNEMNVAGYTDQTGNWFAGTAAKAAYNFHPTKHFVVQPTLLASYNYFHQQNWWTQFGEMNMNAGRLNGVNVAPGLNLIYGRETWSVYATVQYMFNILGSASGNAGNVVLPDVRMKRSYIEYGIGATKTWKDRFSAYLQITLRNVARTGVGFQGGFSFKF